jgi:hypothetical protein
MDEEKYNLAINNINKLIEKSEEQIFDADKNKDDEYWHIIISYQQGLKDALTEIMNQHDKSVVL